MPQKLDNKKKIEFEEVYRKYAPDILRFALIKTSSREEAEDIVAETFLRLWDNYFEKTFAIFFIRNVRAYLYKTARNLTIDFYRKKDRKNISMDDGLREIISDGQSIFQEVSDQKEIEEIIGVIRKLDESYQEVLILHYVEDFTIQEIAEISGLSNGNVRIRLHRGLQEVKRMVSRP